ncbi:hypothetical protein BOX15_Mlig020394g2 [Macrostomum lignano]|uniref:N-formylglutamate amidohydrolase n=1 Tax=Macrostomum lignano TaxID=282301 RepID=A0A267H1Y0_9PLAT|nr:hypothetical protein BOX15_Mlig020394g2 [Macrostomum lignano]
MLALLLLPCLLLSSLTAETSIPNDWIEYTPGDCNLIISSPHGGWLRPAEIEDRTHGCLAADGVTCRWEKSCSPVAPTACRAVTGADINTQQVAAQLVEHLAERYSCRPHFIRANLHRSKLDPNRPVEQAAQGDRLAQAAWKAYHETFMTAAMERVQSRYGIGLVLDIHGQSHPEQWTELGYVLSKELLNAGPQDLSGSSIRALQARTGQSARELLSGRLSLGSLMESAGYKVVPSRSHPSPGSGNYFSGGYITQRYSSLISGQIDAIQVEIASGIRLNPTACEKFGADLAQQVDQFRRINGYDISPRS